MALLAAVLGCRGEHPPGIALSSVTQQTPGAASRPQGAPRVLRSVGKEAQLKVVVNLAVAASSPLSRNFHLLSLPASWNAGAVVELFSPTANTTTIQVPVLKTSFAGGPTSYTATVGVPPLRPASDYQARIYLQDTGGSIASTRLAGSQSQAFTLVAGPNTLTFNVVVNSAPTISTVVGNGTATFAGDGAAATAASLNTPKGLALDLAGNLYIADSLDHRIRKVTGTTISTVAGNGTGTFAGDGGSAIVASLNQPEAVAVDGSGNLFIADTANNRLRKVVGTTISTIAGTGATGLVGDGGVATSATIDHPTGLAFDGADNLFVADFGNNRIRKITLAGNISTVAGGGLVLGDGGAATSALLNNPVGVAFDASGNMYISDCFNHRVRKVTPGGTISTVAGNGTSGFSGDGGPANAAQLNAPRGLAVDAFGNLFVGDANNDRIRRIDAGGVITTFAGTGVPTFGGDGGLATQAQVRSPYGVVVAANGKVLDVETYNHRVRQIDTTALATYDVAAGSSLNSNVVTGNSVVKDDTVTLDTGLTNNQPGIGYVLIYLYGACYTGSSGGSRTLVAKLTTPANWQTFPWDTSATPAAPATYLPANLVGAAGTSPAVGQVDVESYDTASPANLVGKASFALNVFGRPQLGLTFQ